MVITRSPRSRVHLAVLLATCLLLGLGVAQGRAATRSVYFGAYVNLTNKWTKTARVREIRAYQHALGRRLAINHRYYGWSADLANWETRWDVAKGRRPLLSWSSVSPGCCEVILPQLLPVAHWNVLPNAGVAELGGSAHGVRG